MLTSIFSSFVVFVIISFSSALILLGPEDTALTGSEWYNFTTIDDESDGHLASAWNLQVPDQPPPRDPADDVTLVDDFQLPRRKKRKFRGQHGSWVNGQRHQGHHGIKHHVATGSQNFTSQEQLIQYPTKTQRAFTNEKQPNDIQHESLRSSDIYATKFPSSEFLPSDSTHEQTKTPHSRRKRAIRTTISRRRNDVWSNLRQRIRTMRVRQYSRDHPRAVMARMARPVIVSKKARVEAKVGVLVVLDNSVFRQYLEANGQNAKVAVAKIRRYYGMVFAMMDERFKTIKDPLLSVTVRISGILIAETREDSLWLEKIANWSKKEVHGRASVMTDKTLSQFSKWISSRKDLPEYDHAMLFTAYRLSNNQDVGLGGMAYLNAICDTDSGNSVSVVGDQGDFQCVKVATHELAHSLGAKHDGEPGCESCPSSSNYIMSSLTTNKPHALKNAFYFSPCSIRDMITHLSKAKASCVRNEPRVYYSYDMQRLPPGRIYNAHVQCKLIFGNKSEFCWVRTLADIMCGQLWCRDPNLSNGCRTNSYLSALPGTQCAAHKVCHLGECVQDTFHFKNSVRQRSQERTNTIPNIPRPSYRMRGPRRTRRHRNPYKPRPRPRARIRLRTLRHERRRQRQRHHRRRNRCKGDKNARYCSGLIKLNPSVCKRKAVRQYCCLTCRRR